MSLLLPYVSKTLLLPLLVFFLYLLSFPNYAYLLVQHSLSIRVRWFYWFSFSSFTFLLIVGTPMYWFSLEYAP